MLVAEPDLVLEYGDRAAVIAARAALPALRNYFGDSIKSTTEVSYVSVGLGMSLGVLLGLVQVPIPGLGQISMGVAGGPLVAALVLGKLGRTGPLVWHLPLPANLTLRTFGLTMFLAAVGLGSGAPFVQTLADQGLAFVAISVAIVLGAMLVAFLVGPVPAPHGHRRSAGHSVGSNRQPRHTRVREQDGLERSDRRCVRHNFSVDDDFQDHLHAGGARTPPVGGAATSQRSGVSFLRAQVTTYAEQARSGARAPGAPAAEAAAAGRNQAAQGDRAQCRWRRRPRYRGHRSGPPAQSLGRRSGRRGGRSVETQSRAHDVAVLVRRTLCS